MIGIIHCADIHLSIKEKDYSFSVLDEIVSLTNENNCRYLIFAGDIFDSYSDLEKLRFDFRKSLGGLDPHVRVLFIAGNHEEIGGKSADIPKFILSDNANFFMPDDNRIKFIRDAEVEFILMPFRKNRSEPQESVIPEKKSFRIAVAHGMVPGMSYNGIDDEAVSGCIDPYIFVKYRIDYAALGHLHSKNGKTIEGVRMEYPGSSRVWRKNETGERGINFIAVDKNITLKFIPLKKAGQYREFEMPLMPDGCAVTELNSAGTGSYDWINVRFSGLIEDESAVKALASELERSHFSHVRKFTSDTEGIDVLAGITGNPLAKRFLDILESKRHLYGRDLFMKMRQIGLKEIKTIIEARK